MILLDALPWHAAAQQAPPPNEVSADTRRAAELAHYAKTCNVEKPVRDRFDRRALAWLEARQGRDVAAGADGEYRAAASAKSYPAYLTEGLCRQFGCAVGGGQVVAASPPPDCRTFVPRFLGMRINKPGWVPKDGLQ